MTATSNSSSGVAQENGELCTNDFASLIPSTTRGMKTLDKTLYNVNVTLPAIKCKPQSCGKFLKSCKCLLLKRPHFRKIVSAGKSEATQVESKLVLLDSSVNTIEKLTTEQMNVIESEGAMFSSSNCLSLSYEDFSFSEIIQSILPEDAESVTAFETVGHIAHVNLKKHLDEYKYIIGEVLLDKNAHIKTVVNKTTTIEETFRFFKMEQLAGEDRMLTKVSEHGCTFEFDYSKVYWNSRLQSEHKRIVDQIKPLDLVFDVFAGVGPFSIPAAKNKCIVYANDLNKVSYDALLHNAKINKVGKFIEVFNMDGRDFLNDIVISKHLSCQNEKRNIHIIMNLPAIASQFLDVFQKKSTNLNLPVLPQSSQIVIHCYGFSKSKTPEEDAVKIISEAIGEDISSRAKTHIVRRVAPNKIMFCVSFNLSWEAIAVESKTCENTNMIVGTRKRHLESEC